MLMTLLALLIAFVTSRYLTLNPAVFFEQQREVYLANSAMLFMHVAGSILALVIGPFVLLPHTRTARRLPLHRWLGRIYLGAVLFGGMTGLYMATIAYGGLPTRLGFASLSVLWLFSGAMAYTRIRKGDIANHRAWMIRNYALTFAGVMLRLWLGMLIASGLQFESGYRVVAWLSWIPNLAVAQVIITRRANEVQRVRAAL